MVSGATGGEFVPEQQQFFVALSFSSVVGTLNKTVTYARELAILFCQKSDKKKSRYKLFIGNVHFDIT